MDEIKRQFKIKRPTAKFFCALCSAPRVMKVQRNLSKKNIFQISIIGTLFSLCLYPFWEEKSFVMMLVVWSLSEVVHKFLYRKELVCPHCGFDAAWYVKDVRKAKEKVIQFHQHLDPSKQQSDAIIEASSAEG